jgi:hypothetical protein
MKKLGVFAMAVALMAPVVVLNAGPAGAAGGTTCAKVGGKITLSPGLSTVKKAQKITFTLPFSGCKGGGVTSAKSTGTTNAKPGTCATFGKGTQTMPITSKIIWNTKATSTFTGTTKTTGVNTAISGKVTIGLFKGLKVSLTVQASLDKTSGKCTTASPLKKLNIKNVKPFVIK